MEYPILILAAFLAAILTFFSGFGLGTILAPVMALFFPVELAIALTGAVHFLNNVFKLFLIGRKASREVLIRFGIPAVVASFAGAWVLLRLSGLDPLYRYSLGAGVFEITPVKLVVSVLLILFSVAELTPFFSETRVSRGGWLVGGLLSGFFGGLAGLQGAIRGAFLIRAGLSKEVYIGTSVAIACFVDVTRLSVYASRFVQTELTTSLPLLFAATAAALAGSYLGNRLLNKITLEMIQKVVAFMLIAISVALGTGMI